MDLEEARQQLDLIDHDFFLFRDRESGELQVIYRRNHGGYGVIQGAGLIPAGRSVSQRQWPITQRRTPDLPPLMDQALLDPLLNQRVSAGTL